MDAFTLKLINNALIAHHGKHGDGRAKWRLIENTPLLTERRYGIFGKFDAHGNYLGEEECVREVAKYNYIPNGIYILEQLYFTPFLPYELDMATISNNGTYEVRWPFMTNDMKYLEPTLEGCEFIIKCIQTINKKVRETELERSSKRIEATKDALSEGEPAFIGPTIGMDSTKVFEKEVKSGEVPSET